MGSRPETRDGATVLISPVEQSATQVPTKRPPDPSTAGIFQQPWWLESAAGSQLETTSVFWSGQPVACMSFVRKRRFGITRLEMPPYTRTLGPNLQLPASGPAKYARNLHRAMAELVTALPPHDRFQTTLSPDDASAFPLLLSGCNLGQNYTFRSPKAWNHEQHWKDLDQKTRNLIRSSGKELEVSRNGSIEDLIELALHERGRDTRMERGALRRLAAVAQPRGQMATLTAREDGNVLTAVATVVWDRQVLYFWQSARNPASTRSGAVALLVWEAMTMAHSMGLVFDIDGYHSLSSARFVSRFALLPSPRATVLHMSGRGRLLQATGRLFGRGSGLGTPPLPESGSNE